VYMAIINLILYLIINVINIPINYKILNFSGIPLQKSYLYIFFTGPKLIMFNRILTRIQGVFWEPGLYQIFLNLALLSYLFQEKKHKKKIIFILIVSIILTYSTTGYILGIVLIFIKLLAMIRDMKNNKILKFLLITFMPIITLICIYFALKIMILKINAGINYGNKSYSIRTTDLIDCAKQFLKTPIIGSGFFNYSVLPRKGSVNGLFSIFYQTGIIGTFILLVIPMKRLFGKFKKEICLEFAIGFILWLIMSLMNEPIQYSNFILMIISYGYLFNYEKYNKNKFF
ncbi:O-antigen ligase family protein, partial [Clostridium thermobutyricum]